MTLNAESGSWYGKAIAAANYEVPVEQESVLFENCHTNEQDVIAREVKFPFKKLATTKISTMVKEKLDEILRTSFHNTESSLRSVDYNVVEPVALDVVHKGNIEETLDAHMAKFFDSNAAARRVKQIAGL